MLNQVLCVDDDPITLMLYKKVIDKVNYSKEVKTLINGEEALEYFAYLKNERLVTPPELVLLDINMPLMDGWRFLDNYLKMGYNLLFNATKFIVLSSSIDPNDVDKSKEYPMVIDFISKPITKDILSNLKL